MEVEKPSEFEQEFAAAIAGEQDALAAPVQESAAQPAPAPEPAPTAAPESKPLTLEDLQRQLQQVQHQARSDASRVSAFARENNRLKTLLEELNAKGRAGAPVAPDPAPAKLEEDVLTSAPDLESAVKRRVKEVTNALEEQVKDLTQRVQTAQTAAGEAREAIEPIRQSTYQKQIEATHAALDDQFTPKWRDDVRSQDFSQWLDRQPDPVKNLYESAVTAEDSASVMARFYAGHRQNPKAAPVPQAPAPAGNPQTERLRQAAGIAPRGNSRPPTGPAEDDFEGNFQQAVRLRKTA